MKIAIIAGNRLLPVLLARAVKEQDEGREIVAVCFKGETSQKILSYVSSAHWIRPGELGRLRDILKEEKITQCIMAGQISPWRIFFPGAWDKELAELVKRTRSFCPHNIFTEIINYLEASGVQFLDSTLYLRDYLATRGLMNNIAPLENVVEDIEFGVEMIKRYVELDIGQTIVVRAKSVVAAEALEGTDNNIRRGGKIARGNAVVVKFSKQNQDMRFDVPVVGFKTLDVLSSAKAAALVLEEGRVLVLEKEKFLAYADKRKISIIGKPRA